MPTPIKRPAIPTIVSSGWAPTSKYENETMAHITDPPAEGYIREAKFRGQIRHSGEKDKGTHGEGWHRARGHLVVLPSGGSSPSPSLPLSPHLWQEELSKAGGQKKPPPPRVAATQLRKGGLSWAANKWIKETWEEMNDVTKSEGSRGPNSLLPRTVAQNRSDYFGHDATMTTKLNSCLQYLQHCPHALLEDK